MYEVTSKAVAKRTRHTYVKPSRLFSVSSIYASADTAALRAACNAGTSLFATLRYVVYENQLVNGCIRQSSTSVRVL